MRTLILLVTLLPTAARAGVPSLELAARWTANKNDAQSRLGLIEMKRAAGQGSAALDDLERNAAGDGYDDLLCWRLLPRAGAEPERLQRALARLRERPETSWKLVYELSLALAQRERPVLLTLAATPNPTFPEQFPDDLAEKAHFELLRALGLSPSAAGLEVIRNRTFEPLYALRDLDRGLTREAEFLTAAGRPADAAVLRACCERLRQAYRTASRHVVERLFVLHLQGQDSERDALLEKLKTVPYVQDAKARKELFARLDEDFAWRTIVQPLLESEVAFVENPPDLDRPPPGADELQVEADQREGSGPEVRYTGHVKISLGQLRFQSDTLVLHRVGDMELSLVGSGKVRISGVPGCNELIAADRFTFSSDTGTITLGGDIRIPLPSGMLKLRGCSINRAGAIGERRSLIDDFRQNVDTDYRLELLPKIARIYNDDELTSDVRYWIALNLLRPHLTWHAPYLPPPTKNKAREELRDVSKALEEAIKSYAGGRPWQSAHTGEYWMRAGIPTAQVEAFQRAIQNRAADEEPKVVAAWAKLANREAFSWRLRDPGHADVARSRKLLQGIKEGEFAAKAARWLAEIRRNNTVVTFDVAGSYGPAKTAPLVVDVRNADKLALSLYRVAKAEELLAACDHIGEDFIFRDHALHYGDRREQAHVERLKDLARYAGKRRSDRPAGDFAMPGKPLAQWEADVGEMEVVTGDHEERERHHEVFDDPEAEYFDDACEDHLDRLDKSYRPEHRALSSWRCDRIVRVPGRMLVDPGAYILVAEANGRRACVPILVDPLSLSLLRCHDGVFVTVHDPEGFVPIPNASVTARHIVREAKTDAAGAAFAKVAAAGDRAIVAEKDGRFAVGGFGRVFEGVYSTVRDNEHDRFRFDVLQRAHKLREEMAAVFEDRYVVAAYTDRPTYRPGQEVQFKIIVRRLMADDGAVQAKAERAFRADDYEWQARLEIPKETAFEYAWLDSKGRVVTEGRLELNDFGTAAQKLTLNAEAATGEYSLRLKLAGRARLVPDVFSVRNYRRPTFEIKVAGIPDQPGDYTRLNLQVRGEYYFGKAVENGRVSVQLLSPGGRLPHAEKDAQLDAAGKASIQLDPLDRLPSGSYQLVVALTDASGRTVQRLFPLEIKRKNDPAPRAAFAELLCFLPLDKELVIRTTAKEVIAEQGRSPEKKGGNEYRSFSFPVKDGQARIRFPQAGWYSLTAGNETTDVFVFGGQESPAATWTRGQKRREKAEHEFDDPAIFRGPPPVRWVDQSDTSDNDEPTVAAWTGHGQRLLALLSGHRARIGETYRLLVYVPSKKARLIFTYEGISVRDYHVVAVDGSTSPYHVVELPIRARCLPHFYLAGHALHATGADADSMFKDLDIVRMQRAAHETSEEGDPRWRRIDVTDLRPRPNLERLAVDVKADRDVYRPGDKVNVALRVKDVSGKPVRAEISLSAVDESLFTFGEDQISGLAAVFADTHPAEGYRPKTWRGALGRRWQILNDRFVNGHEVNELAQKMLEMAQAQQAAKQIRELMMPLGSNSKQRARTFSLTGAMLPASSIPFARLRSDFRETAAWLPQLRTDANGEARADFKLPDTLTRYRLTAVALNKQADIGTARTTIQAKMPLSVQLVLPRFAVEKDSFTAFGLLHNTTEREQNVEYTWELKGIATPAKDLTGKIAVPAGQTRRVDLPMIASEAGTAEIALRASSGKEADAEKRGLPIHPLGREREVVLEGSFQGKGTVLLPEGFAPREIKVIMAQGEVARALEGLGYLIDYPYGCVEQTMSRFLPAVVIRDASRRAPIHLAPEINARLPLVLSQGLARLYRFQHADGGWGWWEHDASNDGMSAYVVFGLAVCRRSGTTVDANVLERGCEFLRQRLREGKLPRDVAARAWQALAIAGRADAKEAALAARQLSERNATDDECARMALACRTLGLREEADRLGRSLLNWQLADAEGFACLLQVRLAFGASLAECRAAADAVLKARVGERWPSTQATAAAILALAEYTTFVTAAQPAKAVAVRSNGKEIAAVTGAEALARLVYRLNVPVAALGGNRSLELLAEADAPILYTVVARGIQKLDQVEARGKEVRIRRQRETLDGQALDRPLKVGEVCAVRVTVELERPRDFMIVEDRRPMNCEFADEQVVRKFQGTWANSEFRDDRLCLFFTHLAAGKHEFVYFLRAETPGLAHLLPGCAYPMYAEAVRGEMASDRLEVK